ncbi:Uncharacterized protein TCM_039370 [Theobroma cacao]|uniref:DUF1985 domain-containing protein n=1 Tax=Theobroma cacao TaxID=3641 RepID=A0A061GXY4_THECC|nr:Uncharacterized protein TCM_039370 [Theobroma cacao]
MEGSCETPKLRVGDTPWWECVTRQRSELIQHRQYEDLDSLLIMQKEKWAFNVAINTHCKWSQLHYITKTLQQKGEYDPVKRTCFGMLLDFYPQGYFCADLLHNIMIRRITERQSMNHELWFSIGDATKMALVLITNNILFGQDYRRRVTPWLLSLVEDIDAWNVFPWGYYVWKLTLDYLLKGFEVPDLSVTKETRLRYNIYGFAWVIQTMEAISAFRKIVAPSGSKDNVHPRMCRWDYNQKPKYFYKTIQKLESSDQLWALETLEPTADEALREYFMDLDVLLSEGNKYLDHGPATSEPPIGPSQMQSGNDPSFTEARTGPQAPIDLAQSQTANEPVFTEAMTGPEALIGSAPPHIVNEPVLTQSRIVNDGAVTTRQLRRIMCKHEKDMLELKASIQSLSVAMHTIEDRIVGWILDGLKSQGGPSHAVGLEHDDANDGQHHEPGVDIGDDVLGADGEHVTHVDDVVEEAMVVDATLQSDDVEGEHLPPADAFVDVAAGAIVLYRESTPDVVEIRSSSPESSVVHHGAAEISDPTERAQLKMASKYMASPFVDPLRNVGILEDQGADFFITLEDPNEEMTSEHIDACLGLFCKRMTGPKSKLYTTRACMVDMIFFDTIRMLHIKFPTEDARAKMRIPSELRGYVKGERPTYAKK